MYTFILVGPGPNDEGVMLYSTGTAKSIDDIIEQWVDPTVGWVPDHIENIEGDFEEGTSAEVIKEEAVRQTKERFGIGCKRNEVYSNDWRIIQVDLTDGSVETYHST